ncbi:hypothetical protein [Massilia sp. Se16.2.3]|nr:hypothetical protein [Massilia sp. Se16.2.3]QNB01120.1 hypothetical protein G4G31_23725 [Massilia sp. Se16.2.3]
MKKKILIPAALALALAATVGSAQPPATSPEATPATETNSADEAPVQTVQVRGVRDPALMPYEKAYDFLTRLRKAGDGRMDMVIRILSARTQQPIPDLEVFLQGETTYRKLALSPEGFLTMVLDPAYLKDKVAILTNKPKGAIVVEYYFVPTLPADGLRFADIGASIAAVKRAQREVLPWYLRPFMGTIREVMLCYPRKDQELLVTQGETVVRPANIEQKNMLSRNTVYCAVFNEAEARKAPDSLVAAPASPIALFR